MVSISVVKLGRLKAITSYSISCYYSDNSLSTVQIVWQISDRDLSLMVKLIVLLCVLFPQ